MSRKTEPPGFVMTAIGNLQAGQKAGFAEAHEMLQEAVLGSQGCLRKDLPHKVPWADTCWSTFTGLLDHDNNHVRAIAGQVLCNLARSTPPETVLRDLETIVASTGDEKFVTGRHILQALWKIGLGDQGTRKALLDALADRFKTCTSEKNASLMRYDIVVGLRTLYDEVGDKTVLATARNLISSEDDPKYRKKYASAWGGLISLQP